MSRFNEFRWSVATKVAAWSGSRLYRPIKALLTLSVVAGVAYFSYSYGKDIGATHGVDFYHSMCYTTGGMIIDEQGRAVLCSPLTQIPEQELQQGLTKT